MANSTTIQTASTRLSTKGQLIIPKAIRERYGWRPGSTLLVEDLGNGVMLRASEPPESSIEELIGCTGYAGPRKSLEEMEEAIARGVAERG